ncbi:MAG: peptide transporter ATP-binding protein [Bryobacterales bacterium]|nr:peptide transporter ATP-binding protein [Bryobacterales bacterium]
MISLLAASNLSKSFRPHRGIAHPVLALRNIDLSIEAGSVTAVIGGSGAGKSVLARCLSGHERPTQGTVSFAGVELTAKSRPHLVQLVPQDPAASLNPRFTACELVAEPLRIQGVGTSGTRRDRALGRLKSVGLPASCAGRRADEFSAGERARIALARALVLEPRLLILDESLSSLDVPVQAAITGLLSELKSRHSLTYLLVAHDLTLVRQIACAVVVMDAGEIVERGPVSEVLGRPQHPATVRLIEGSPRFPDA